MANEIVQFMNGANNVFPKDMPVIADNITINPETCDTIGASKIYRIGNIAILEITNLQLKQDITNDTIVATLPYYIDDIYRGIGVDLTGKTISFFIRGNLLYVSGLNSPTTANLYGCVPFLLYT